MRSQTHNLRRAIGAFRSAFVSVGLMSGVVNILALTGAFYMLQVYDRVLTSHSVPTLVAFSVLAAGLYLFQGILDVLRGQILVRIGVQVDRRVSPIAHDAMLKLPLLGTSTTQAQRPVNDVDAIRAFLGSQGPVAIFDLPWMPLYLAFVYFLHPWLGLLATAGMLVLVVLTLLTEFLSSGLNSKAVQTGSIRSSIADVNVRNTEVLRAMGFGDRMGERYRQANNEYLDVQSKTSDVVGGLSGVSRVFRMLLQSAVLGLGAYLTLTGHVTAGAIIAASIATSRALAPIEQAIGQWKGFVAARQAYGRLKRTLSAIPIEAEPLSMPRPVARLTVEGVSVAIPSTQQIALSNISFELSARQGLGIIGPSGSGKSTLVRAITGIWPLARGAVRLDAVPSDRWPDDYFSDHIGYLPQDVSLLDGSVAQNIARFDPTAEASDIVKAAQAADVHELILRLPEGYETQLGLGGTALSAGQRQRIALARALYRDPFMVVLDEPNSNLDAEGEAALTAALQKVRERDGIAIVIAHRPSALQALDQIAIIRDGKLAAYGPRDQVMREYTQRPAVGSA